MLRLRPALLVSFLIFVVAGCAKDEFADPSGKNPSQPAPPGPSGFQQPVPPPQFEAGAQSVLRVVPGTGPESAPLLEVHAWTRDGRKLQDLEYDVYWQTDEGPSLTAGKLGPEGSSQKSFPSGALIHRLLIRPTGYSAPLWIQVSQFVQPGRVLRVDGLVLPAAILSGVVLDENGAPIPGASLAGFQQPILRVDEADRPAVDNLGVTDENGAFRLGGFGPGPFVLEAGFEGRITVWRVAGALAEGQEIGGIELQMEPAHTVHGQVLSDSGEPVKAARIVAGKTGRRQLTRPGPTPEISYVPARQAVARSDDNGVFQLLLVPDSQEWNVNVDHPRFHKFLGRLEAGQVDLVVRLVRGLEARGTVFDHAGERLTGASVVLLGGSQPLAVQSNRQGVFAIGGLDEEAGRFLYVSHAEHAPLLLGPVDLSSGQHLEIHLSARVQLGGTLSDGEGRPLGGARVTLRSEALPEGFPPEHYPAELLSLQSGLSSASGAFSFDGIPAGLYRAEVTAQDGRTQSFSGLSTGSEDLKLVLTAER
ncbi:MAG: carboxypeptidase-like regulatory domain-containing protein [Planctomycetota bacterium]|nr:carboxypeptidase-like regulatory domain-containing protein [Planctomycetota bacterium]